MLTSPVAAGAPVDGPEADTSGRANGASKPNYTARNVTGAVILLLLIGGLGSIHIVKTDSGYTFVPKEHFTFSMTFTSVDEVVTRWNSQTNGDRDALVDNLDRQLEKRGYITSRKKTWEEIGNDVNSSLPDK